MSVKSKPKRRGQTSGRTREWKKASSSCTRTTRSSCSRARSWASRWPIKKHKPTSPGRRFATWSRPRGGHARRAREVARRGPQEVRRAQLLRPHHLAPPRRRRQAQVPHHRLQAHARTACRPRSPRSSTTRTAPPTSRCSTTPTARSATSSRRRGCASAAPCESGPSADIAVGQLPAAAQHPHGHDRPQRRAHARPRRPDGPLRRRRRSSWSRRRASARRCACPRARCGWSPSDCRATIGTIGNAEHQNIDIGKAGRSRHKGKRPQTRGTAMNPVDHPHGGGEGSTTPGRHPVTPWGVPTLGYPTRKKNKQSDRWIVAAGAGRRGSAECPALPRRDRGSRSA